MEGVLRILARTRKTAANAHPGVDLESASRIIDQLDRTRPLPAEAASARVDINSRARAPEIGAIGDKRDCRNRLQRRFDDRRPDLWSVFNRTQENLVRGGLETRSANGRRMRTREVRGISENVQLNRALWTLANEMVKLKAAA